MRSVLQNLFLQLLARKARGPFDSRGLMVTLSC